MSVGGVGDVYTHVADIFLVGWLVLITVSVIAAGITGMRRRK